MGKLYESYLKPPKNHQKVRRDFPAQLARQRFGITLSFYRFAHGEALRVILGVERKRNGKGSSESSRR